MGPTPTTVTGITPNKVEAKVVHRGADLGDKRYSGYRSIRGIRTNSMFWPYCLSNRLLMPEDTKVEDLFSA
jgi:hypothetical protein